MDGWGSLTMLIKRQNAAKNRKNELKYQLQKNKESYLKNKGKNDFDFPELSNSEMTILKQQIRKNLKKEKIKNMVINLTLVFASFLTLYFIIIHIKN